MKAIAASRRAAADASKVSDAVFAPTAPAAASSVRSSTRAASAVTALVESEPVAESISSPRPTSTVPHQLPLQSDVASALPADFFDAVNASAESSGEPIASDELDPQPTAATSASVNTLPHPIATFAAADEGELVSAELDAVQVRVRQAVEKAARERRDTEAAIAFAVSLSKQQSQPMPAATRPATDSRPASPVPVSASSIPDALAAFEAELAAAEAETAESSAEEASRLATMRRSMDEAVEDDRRQRLDDIKRRVAEGKRRRDEEALQTRADKCEAQEKRRRAEPGVSRREAAETGDDGDLLAELDDMFTWRKQR